MKNVIVAGLTASGKTTHSKFVAEKTGLNYISGSAIRGELLGIPGDVAGDARFWRDSDLADVLDEQRLSRIDKRDVAVEAELIAIARTTDQCIFDTWTMPWVYRNRALCIYLRSSPEVRARRLFHKDVAESYEDVLKKIEQKDKRAQEFFRLAYGVDIFFDMSPFDIVIDSNEQDEDSAAKSKAMVSSKMLQIVQLFLTGDVRAIRHLLSSMNGDPDRNVTIWRSTDSLNWMSQQIQSS